MVSPPGQTAGISPERSVIVGPVIGWLEFANGWSHDADRLSEPSSLVSLIPREAAIAAAAMWTGGP